MTAYALDKRTKLFWVTGAAGITNIAAPTVAELNAGTDLTPYLTADGFDPGFSTNRVADDDLISGIDKTVPGTTAVQPTLKLKRHIAAGDDGAWTLWVRDTEGFLVYRTGDLYTVAWTAAQRIQVFKGIMSDPEPMATAKNALNVFNGPFNIQDSRVKGVVAA